MGPAVKSKIPPDRAPACHPRRGKIASYRELVPNNWAGGLALVLISALRERTKNNLSCHKAAGIFPNEQSIIRHVGTVLLEQNVEWRPAPIAS